MPFYPSNVKRVEQERQVRRQDIPRPANDNDRLPVRRPGALPVPANDNQPTRHHDKKAVERLRRGLPRILKRVPGAVLRRYLAPLDWLDLVFEPYFNPLQAPANVNRRKALPFPVPNPAAGWYLTSQCPTTSGYDMTNANGHLGWSSVQVEAWVDAGAVTETRCISGQALTPGTTSSRRVGYWQIQTTAPLRYRHFRTYHRDERISNAGKPKFISSVLSPMVALRASDVFAGVVANLPHIVAPGQAPLPGVIPAALPPAVAPLQPVPIRRQVGEPSWSPLGRPSARARAGTRANRYPTIVATPGGLSRLPGTVHKLTPPKKGTKERKGTLRAIAAGLGDIFGAATEGMDLIKAAHEALPEIYQAESWYNGQRITPSIKKQAVAVYRFYDKVDLDQFAKNVFLDSKEDALIGKLAKGAKLPGDAPGISKFGQWGR